MRNPLDPKNSSYGGDQAKIQKMREKGKTGDKKNDF